MKTCLKCDKEFEDGAGIRNCCTPEGEFPFCSHDCAQRSYWANDLPAFLKDFNKRLDERADTKL